jgi:8-oxo-dGDP phosphatase
MTDEGARLLNWRVLSERLILSDRWITVRAQVCETAEGARIEPFYLVDTQNVVAVTAITTDDNLVLVRQYRHGFGGSTLELPAGAVDAGEELLSAAARELKEETGYVGGAGRVLKTFSSNTLRYTARMHAVVIEGVSRLAKPQDDPLERIEPVLWPMARVDELFAEREFANAAVAGCLALALSWRAKRQDG